MRSLSEFWISRRVRGSKKRPSADREQLGAASELWVARAARKAGWRVWAQRLPVPAAEVDLVAFDGRQWVCLEVKSGWLPQRLVGLPPKDWDLRWRPGQHFDAEQFLRYQRALPQVRTRLIDAGLARRTHSLRIDLVEVLWTRSRPRPTLLHHRGIHFPGFRPESGLNPISIQAGLSRQNPGVDSEPGGV